MFICGSFTHGQKKPCKTCKHFCLWGIAYGYCDKHNEDMPCGGHCKYYKRESTIWDRNGKCKVNEYELYA